MIDGEKSSLQERLRLYKSTLQLRSFSASPWLADTLFGHLCWFIVRSQGAADLQRFLGRYKVRQGDGDPPVLLSDGFPADYLPRPILLREESAIDLPKAERINFQREAKRVRQADWLTLDEFNKVRRGEIVNPSLTQEQVEKAVHLRATTKNWINRLTDTAGDPYDVSEIVLPRITIYWRIEDASLPLVSDFLADLKKTGYGKRKSIGYGQVESFTPPEEFSGFVDVPDANGFVTLSRFVPAPDDPTEGFWNAIVKYGKLGEELAASRNPFKRPLVQLACGSCFRAGLQREWYGQLVSGLSVQEEVKHYGFAFPVPMKLADLAA
jgi:CRISPR-associated protein Csm4